MIQKIITEIQSEVDKLDVTDPTQNGIAEGLLTAKRIAEKAVQKPKLSERLTAKRIAEKAVQKPKLSDLLKTDCDIDCGSNEKLMGLVEILPGYSVGLELATTAVDEDAFLLHVIGTKGFYLPDNVVFSKNPIYKLEDIEL